MNGYLGNDWKLTNKETGDVFIASLDNCIKCISKSRSKALPTSKAYIQAVRSICEEESSYEDDFFVLCLRC